MRYGIEGGYSTDETERTGISYGGSVFLVHLRRQVKQAINRRQDRAHETVLSLASWDISSLSPTNCTTRSSQE
jgi:hypothetical protein